MSETDSNSLDVMFGAVTGLAAPVRTSFLKALNDLLGGLTAIPAAKLKQFAQSIEDTTAARSLIAAMIAKTASESMSTDHVLMQAAAEVYFPTALRKARNRIGVAQKAAEHISEKLGEEPNAAPPEDDWMNVYVRFAEDASSEKLQDMFGRILAGQIVRPGSFALSTMRAVAELDQSIAEDFSLVWAKSVGDAVDYSAEFQLGEWFARWKRLAEAGLMAHTNSSRFLPPFTPLINGNALWGPMTGGETTLLVHFSQDCNVRWEHIALTRTGREIGSILPRPDYEANMRDAGKSLAGQGIARIELIVPHRQVEILYQAPIAPEG
jgi:hypothetical protein